MLRHSWCWVLSLVALANWGGTKLSVAHDNPLFEAQILERNVCQLHASLDAHGADPATDRYVCRLETAVVELLDKLVCPHDVGAIECALREAATWLERTTVGVEANCRLHTDFEVVRSLEATHASLARTAKAIECSLNKGVRLDPTSPFGRSPHHPSVDTVPLGATSMDTVPLGGVPFGVNALGSVPFGGVTSPFGRSPHHPSVDTVPFGVPALGSVPFGGGVPFGGAFGGAPLGSVPLGGVPLGGAGEGYRAGFGNRSAHIPSPSISAPFSSGLIGGHRSGTYSQHPSLGRGSLPSPPPAWEGSYGGIPNPSTSFGLDTSRGAGGGEIGRAIIEALLSELSRR